MKNVEYIIVGGGFASLFFAHQLLKNKRTFLLYTDEENSASRISAGVVNPVVLKKFTSFWLAKEQVDFLQTVLVEVAEYTERNYFVDAPVHRIFHDENEREIWKKKTSDPILSYFLGSNSVVQEHLFNPYLSGKVEHSGRIDVSSFFTDMFSYLSSNGHLVWSHFNYDDVNITSQIYQDIHFDKIVFCEGVHVTNNPFFNSIPIVPNKGHHLLVQFSMPFTLSNTIKKKHFLFPVDENLYYYGGTYDKDFSNTEVAQYSVEELTTALQTLCISEFTVKEVKVGFRPTVKDRRPILGQHPIFPYLYVFNGLGARGVLNASFFSKILYDFIELSVPLPLEVDLLRFSI